MAPIAIMTPLLVLLLILPPSLGLPSPPSSISWPYMPVRAMPVVHNYLGSCEWQGWKRGV